MNQKIYSDEEMELIRRKMKERYNEKSNLNDKKIFKLSKKLDKEILKYMSRKI